MHDCQYCLNDKHNIGKPRLHLDDASYMHYVECDTCGSRGPVKAGSREAVDAWEEFQSIDKGTNKKAPE